MRLVGRIDGERDKEQFDAGPTASELNEVKDLRIYGN